jgi:hypothetical protein
LGVTYLSQVIKIIEIDPAAKTIKVERFMEEGRQVCTAALPAVVSVVKGINEPRYPSFMGIRKAAKASDPGLVSSRFRTGPGQGRLGRLFGELAEYLPAAGTGQESRDDQRRQPRRGRQAVGR